MSESVLTRDDLVARKEALSQEYLEHQTLVFITNGAMQDCAYLLELLDAREAEEAARESAKAEPKKPRRRAPKA